VAVSESPPCLDAGIAELKLDSYDRLRVDSEQLYAVVFTASESRLRRYIRGGYFYPPFSLADFKPVLVK
jgi:hypothetical protein